MKFKTVLEDCKNTILLEIKELERLHSKINDNYIKSIEKISHCKGKIVVVAIGKPSHIANKIVATFNSIGTPSQFLHASEAIHGDLGMIKNEDVILCISNSGISTEIKNLVPFFKKNASCLISITGNLNGFLAKNSDFVLDSTVKFEACPNNLAPTSSTILQMAIGDALAVALINLKKFKDKDFANYHPGGTLGKNLLWSIEQIIPIHEKPFVIQNASIKEVISSLAYAKSGITAVLDYNNKIIGAITDGDLRRMLVKFDDFQHLTSNEIMNHHPKTIEKKELAKSAYNLMQKHKINQLLITDNDKFFSVLDIHHLLTHGIK